jgi:hypothetical protein
MLQRAGSLKLVARTGMGGSKAHLLPSFMWFITDVLSSMVRTVGRALLNAVDVLDDTTDLAHTAKLL